MKTPTANLGSNGGSQHPDKRKAGGHGPTLADEVEHLLPTPRASDGAKGSPNQRYKNGSPTLASTAATLAPAGPTAATAAQPAPLPCTGTPVTAGHGGAEAEEIKHLLPTPTSADSHGEPGTTPKRRGGMNLRTAVTRLPAGGASTCPPSADGST
ncbi:hypothetical protein ACGF0K_32310 [Streptomyces sp. NPDC048156]|uniref:hypothetical protein n=1 Tax=Streptomyces sp. NPDC048156 TaxID=3365502 RepID=UPI0037194C5F